MRILVAEDTAFWRMKVGEILEGRGHEVVWAEDGVQAWRALEEDRGIGLFITDWEMPGISGLELCRRIRSKQRTPYLPTILLTSREEKKDLAEGLNAGADAFVSKPVDRAELLAQIGVAERILRLEESLGEKVRDLTLAKTRLDRDLEDAAAVQGSLLPQKVPDVPGVEFAWVYDACEIVGGDMFNVFRLDDEQVGLYVLDVSGHGTSAALFSVGLSHILTPFPEQGGILKRNVPGSREPEVVAPWEVALELNDRFQLMEQSRRYVTFLYGILDLARREFRYVRAGHPGPIQITNGRAISHNLGGWIPIGITRDASYGNDAIELSTGDKLVLYTDGVTEVANEHDEEFGLRRVLETLANGSDCGIERRLGILSERIEAFARGRRLRDDVTLLGFGLR